MRPLPLLLLLLLLPPAVTAGIRVQDPWLRAVPPVATNSAGYLRLHNDGSTDDALLGARIDGVRVVELHEMRDTGNGARGMFRRHEIIVPAGESAVLAPGGLHLMLIDLQQPLQADTEVGGVLRFRDAGEVPVRFRVRAN